MATLVIRNVEDNLHARLKSQAAAHRHSMEEEARQLLRQGLASSPAGSPSGFGQAMRAIFEPLGGLDMADIRREPPRDPPDFSGPEWGLPE
jgi:plasmid stability protein